MDKNEIISGYNFSNTCNVIFSRYVSYEEYENLDHSKIIVLQKTNDYIFYRLKSFELSENDSIFCNNFSISSLFHLLKDQNDFKNIKIVSSQTDLPVTKKIFETKPTCVSKWFSVNVEHKSDDLIAIPLGIGNNFQKKYVNPELLENANENFNFESEPTLYLNFRENTNEKHRKYITESFINESWVFHSEPNLSIDNYIKDISSNSFVLAPWGNGIDTHRIWESLYLGSVPVVKYHHSLNTLKDLPVLFVSDYKEINLELLNKTQERFKTQDFNLEKLNLDWWLKNKININNESSMHQSVTIKSNYFNNSLFRFQFILDRKFESYKKKISYYFKRLISLIRNKDL